MLHSEAERPEDDSNDRSSAPVVFSDDGSRWAYVGRTGNQLVVMLDGKELSKIPFSEEAITSLSFTPGGKHLRYIQTVRVQDQSGDSRRDTRLVVDGRKATVGADNLRASEVSWSPDGEHFAFIAKSGDRLSDRLVLDNKVDPPELQFPGYALEHTRPLFTGDSAHLITVRRKLVQQSGSTRLGSQAVFFDRTPVVQAPSAIVPGGSHQKTDANLSEVSVAPMGSNFITVFQASGNPFNLYFNDKRMPPTHPVEIIFILAGVRTESAMPFSVAATATTFLGVHDHRWQAAEGLSRCLPARRQHNVETGQSFHGGFLHMRLCRNALIRASL